MYNWWPTLPHCPIQFLNKKITVLHHMWEKNLTLLHIKLLFRMSLCDIHSKEMLKNEVLKVIRISNGWKVIKCIFELLISLCLCVCLSLCLSHFQLGVSFISPTDIFLSRLKIILGAKFILDQWLWDPASKRIMSATLQCFQKWAVFVKCVLCVNFFL